MTRAVPREIKANGGELAIRWGDEHASVYSSRLLRLSCLCAACVDEWSRQRLIEPKAVPEDVKPVTIDVVGNYALHISWNDGHNTGIYSYDYLRELCECDECLKSR